MAGLSGILLIVAIVYAVVMFLLPFYVRRIMIESIQMNKQMATLIEKLKIKAPNSAGTKIDSAAERPKFKTCGRCGAHHTWDKTECISCGRQI
jgi:hypothetical protein